MVHWEKKTELFLNKKIKVSKGIKRKKLEEKRKRGRRK